MEYAVQMISPATNRLESRGNAKEVKMLEPADYLFWLKDKLDGLEMELGMFKERLEDDPDEWKEDNEKAIEDVNEDIELVKGLMELVRDKCHT